MRTKLLNDKKANYSEKPGGPSMVERWGLTVFLRDSGQSAAPCVPISQSKGDRVVAEDRRGKSPGNQSE